MSIDIDKCKIKMVVDSREKNWLHIADAWKENNIDYYIKDKGLKTGDYTIAVKTPNGEVVNFEDKVVVERKANITELCGNLTDNRDKTNRNRFIRELERAKERGIKLIIVIEDEKAFNKARKGFYREDRPTKLNKKSFMGMLFTYKARYNVEIVWMDKLDIWEYIYNLLHYEAREFLKGID